MALGFLLRWESGLAELKIIAARLYALEAAGERVLIKRSSTSSIRGRRKGREAIGMRRKWDVSKEKDQRTIEQSPSYVSRR